MKTKKDTCGSALPCKPTRHPIVFCGAGPGDPELITIKGSRALERADLVLYAGSLVPEAVLTWAPRDAERISSAGLHLDEIVNLMSDAYFAGKRVVRLHTGDPSLYGAVHEQMARLEEQNIPWKIIPGVTAAFAAAAVLDLEYTVPELSQTLILTRMAGRTPVPESEALSALAAHRASLVIYLSMALLDQAAPALIEAYGPNAPCAVAYRVSQPGQRILQTRLADLKETVEKSGITKTAVIIVGNVLEARARGVQHASKLYDKGFTHGCRPAP